MKENAGRSLVFEPWMKEFVRGRHSREEWDEFLDYVAAGPWGRRWLRCRALLGLGLLAAAVLCGAIWLGANA